MFLSSCFIFGCTKSHKCCLIYLVVYSQLTKVEMQFIHLNISWIIIFTFIQTFCFIFPLSVCLHIKIALWSPVVYCPFQINCKSSCKPSLFNKRVHWNRDMATNYLNPKLTQSTNQPTDKKENNYWTYVNADTYDFLSSHRNSICW